MEFFSGGLTVPISVDPHLQIVPNRVGCIDGPITINVVSPKIFVPRLAGISKEFGSIVYNAITIEVADQQPVAPGGPTNLFIKTIIIDVKMGAAFIRRQKVNAVTI